MLNNRRHGKYCSNKIFLAGRSISDVAGIKSLRELGTLFGMSDEHYLEVKGQQQEDPKTWMHNREILLETSTLTSDTDDVKSGIHTSKKMRYSERED